MPLDFDPAKNARNIRETAVSVEDTRADYGERRIRIVGYIDDLLHVSIITCAVRRSA